jgi:hypothetical protein
MTSSKCLTDFVAVICALSIGLFSHAVDPFVTEMRSCTHPVVSSTSIGYITEDASPLTASGFAVITGIAIQTQVRERHFTE